LLDTPNRLASLAQDSPGDNALTSALEFDDSSHVGVIHEVGSDDLRVDRRLTRPLCRQR